MKLSELSTEKALDVMCQATPYIANIVGDSDLLSSLKEKLGGEKKSIAELYTYGAQKIAQLIPILLKNHRDDVFGLLAVLNDMEPKDIAAQGFTRTLEQIRSAVQDKELIDFFKSWRQEEGKE